ncbi:hypothetical protein GJ496_010664 [Pomphorhynchus laevis]|nr:hypothetical protein GJ496_010664 [Pomphorhynchus laevis]
MEGSGEDDKHQKRLRTTRKQRWRCSKIDIENFLIRTDQNSPPAINTVTTHLQTRKTSCVFPMQQKSYITESKSKSSDSQFVCPYTKPILPGEFFVVCNTCGQSSHGISVGIAYQRNLREAYICAKCTKADSNYHMYCICRQPYDEEHFYV